MRSIYKLIEKPLDESFMEIVTHVLTNEQHYLDDKRKKTARANIEAIGSIKINGNAEDNVKGDVADLSGVVVPTPSAEDNQKVLTAGNDGSYGWNALPEGLAPYDGEPAMDGESSAGSSALLARGDHVHPSDTSKANKSEMSVTTDGDRTTITLKEDTYATVINAHQDISGKVDKVDGKDLSTNDFTDNDKDKLDNIEAGAQVNKIESISANNHALTIDANKNVDIPLATSEVDGLLPKEKFPLIPAVPEASADRIYSFDDTNGTSWQTIVREYVGNMLLDQQGNPVTDEEGEIMYEEEAVPLWLSYKGVEFGARRAYDDHTGANIHDSIVSRTTMSQVTTAIETALANYGGFVVVDSLVDGHPDVADPSERFIYLYKDSQSSAEDPYTEWIYTALGTWDKIGTTSIDVSNFTHKVANATGNIPKLDSNGDLVDSGVAAASLTSKAAVDGGTDLSLVTTGEKYVWNNTRQLPDPTGHVNGSVLSLMHSVVQWDGESGDDFVTFTFPDGVEIGGKQYSAMQIGNLIWMTSNLAYAPAGFINGLTTDGTNRYSDYYYNMNARWGYPYNKAALKYFIDNAADWIPYGWRIPTHADFEYLNNYITAGYELKATTGWNNPNGTDKYGFHGDPSGEWAYPGSGWSLSWLHYGADVNGAAIYWSSTAYDYQSYYFAHLHNNGNFNVSGYSSGIACIRLVKDAPVEE